MECDCCYVQLSHKFKSFNPRTRMECDLNKAREVILWTVSIHALVWSATELRPKIIQYQNVSIHALVWSATQFAFWTGMRTGVSIHALVWSATLISPWKNTTKKFQSTHSYGVRPYQSIQVIDNPCFNPRTRMECDLNYRVLKCMYGVSIHALVWSATV